MGAVAENHGGWRPDQDLHVGPGRPGSRVAQVEPNHLVEGHATASADLPESGDSRLGFQQPAAVPEIVRFDFIGDRRTRTDQGHFAPQHVNELRQLVQAGAAQKRADPGDPWILS